MKKPPRYELKRIDSNQHESDVEIISVVHPPWKAKMNRRGMLGASFCSSAALAILLGGGCDSKSSSKSRAQAETQPETISEQHCGQALAHEQGIRALAITPDGKKLASGSDDSTIKLWELPSGALTHTLSDHFGAVHALAISPDGQMLVSASADATINLWNISDGSSIQYLQGHQGPVLSLAISPDNKTLVSGGNDQTIRFWDLTDGRLIKTLEGHNAVIEALAISPDGQTLASGGRDASIVLWDFQAGTIRQELTEHTQAVYALAVSSDGQTLVSGSADTSIKLWDLPSGDLRQTLNGHSKSVWSLAIAHQDSLLISGSNDFAIQVWDLETGAQRKTLTGHKDAVTALAINPMSQLLASASMDKTIRLRDLSATTDEGICLLDLAVSSPDVEGITYQHTTESGQVITYTQPCGSPIPPDAVCTCNCVSGSYGQNIGPEPVSAPIPEPLPEPAPQPTYSGDSYCSCNKICTCIPVCQAHRVMDSDPVVATMAQEILLIMGEQEFAYMGWAASQAALPLKHRIKQIMTDICGGAQPDPSRWPTVEDCVNRLDSSDDVVALMAAQMLRQREVQANLRLEQGLETQVESILQAAVLRPWLA